MITDFPTAPLAPGLRGAGGSTVEKSLSASHTEILTPPSSRAKCHGAPSISLFLRMLGINQYCGYVINICWDAFN